MRMWFRRVFPALILALLALLFAAIPATMRAQSSSSLTTVNLQITQATSFGTSVFVAGSIPELGNWDVTKAIKLSPHAYPLWQINLKLAPGTTFQYRFLTRLDDVNNIGSSSNANWLPPVDNFSMTVPGTPLPARSGTFRYFSGVANPVLEIQESGGYRRVAFAAEGPGRGAGETLWRAELSGLPGYGDWQFRIDLGGGNYDYQPGGGNYITAVSTLWLQDGQIYTYAPPATPQASQTFRLDCPGGEIPGRKLYVYLPRCYDQNPDRSYPVLYMHDGQNIFASLADGAFGQWNADTVADKLIRQGRMRETIIVGVANSSNRWLEYLPPWATYQGSPGIGDKTFRYYRDTVEPFILGPGHAFRIKPGRENRAVCGSSMGGVLTNYFGWEQTDFAQHLGVVSPAYWTSNNGSGVSIQATNMKPPAPRRDVRIWLDSGTVGGSQGMDQMPNCFIARDALQENGYVLGDDMQHLLVPGAVHNEAAWSARLDRIFLYLLPISQEEPATISTPTPSPSLTPSPSPSASPTPSETASPSATTSLTPTPSPSATESATPSESPSSTPSVTPSETPTPGASLSPSPTESLSPTPTETASLTPSITPSLTPSDSPSLTPTDSPSLTPSPTSSLTATATPSPSFSLTHTLTPAPSATPSATTTPAPTTSPIASPAPTAVPAYFIAY